MSKLYTKEEIKHISGIDYYLEGCMYKFVDIDIRTLVGYNLFEKNALIMKEDTPIYIQFMIDRLKIGGGLPAMLIYNNQLLDGTHRINAYILTGKYIVNALERQMV